MYSSDEEYKKLYALMTTYDDNNKLAKDYNMSKKQINKVIKMLQDIGFKYDLTDEDKRNINNVANSYIQTYQAEINSALRNVRTLANAYLLTNENYAALDEQSKNAASIIVNSIDENIASGFEEQVDVGKYVIAIIDVLKENPEVRDALVSLFTQDFSELSPQQAKELVDQYINYIVDELQKVGIEEDAFELKIRLGFDDVDDLADNYNTVLRNAAEKFTGTNIQTTHRFFLSDEYINLD